MNDESVVRPGAAPGSTGAPGSVEADPLEAIGGIIVSRCNISPRWLVEPGPSAEQLQALMALGGAAPDHGRLTPWRFVLVPPAQRHRLGAAFAQALVDRDANATPEQIDTAREKAFRAPLLLVAIACLGPRQPDTPALERMVSMGAAVQNILLGAHAMGFGAGLTSGQAMSSNRLRHLCGLAEGESAVCCINIGTVSKRKTATHIRPQPHSFLSVLGEEAVERNDA